MSLFAGCNDCTEGASPEFKLTRNSNNETLIVIADDRSGSDNSNRNFDRQDYNDICHFLYSHGGGTIAVISIGNPLPANRQAFRETFEPLYNVLPGSQCYNLSDQGRVVSWNDSVTRINQDLQNESSGKTLRFIDTIQQNVINYVPDRGRDLTLLDNAIESINRIVDERVYEHYQKILLVISSDGINDPGGRASPISIPLRLNSRCELFVIGWKDISYFDSIPQKNILESKAGFMGYLKQQQ